MGALRDRLQWQPGQGAVHDGPRRYLLMRPDVLMGGAVGLPPALRTTWWQAWAAAACEHGGASLRAYAAQGGGDPAMLIESTVLAAADLGWGCWTVDRHAGGLLLQVQSSPFVAGWRAAGGGAEADGVCAPVRGLLQALAQALWPGREVQVHERACACQHVGDACHFEARVEGAAP